MTGGDRASPLRDAHVELGAKLTEFAGWDMPLQYAGIVAEHRVVRSSAGIFDVSHLGKLLLSGPEAGAAIAATASCSPMTRGASTTSSCTG